MVDFKKLIDFYLKEMNYDEIENKIKELNEHLTELFELSVNGATGKELFYTHPYTKVILL